MQLALKQFLVDGLEGYIFFSCYGKFSLELFRVEAGSCQHLHKAFKIHWKLRVNGHPLKVLALIPQKIIELFLSHMLRLHCLFINLKQDAIEDIGLALGERCILENKMPEPDVVVLVIIEEGDESLQEILAQLGSGVQTDEVEDHQIFRFLLAEGVEFLFDFLEDYDWKLIEERVRGLEGKRNDCSKHQKYHDSITIFRNFHSPFYNLYMLLFSEPGANKSKPSEFQHGPSLPGLAQASHYTCLAFA